MIAAAAQKKMEIQNDLLKCEGFKVLNVKGTYHTRQCENVTWPTSCLNCLLESARLEAIPLLSILTLRRIWHVRSMSDEGIPGDAGCLVLPVERFRRPNRSLES